MDRVKKPKKGIIDIFVSIGDFCSQKYEERKDMWANGKPHYDPKTGKRVWAPKPINPNVYEWGDNNKFGRVIEPTRWYEDETKNVNGRKHQAIKPMGGKFTSGMMWDFGKPIYEDNIKQK